MKYFGYSALFIYESEGSLRLEKRSKYLCGESKHFTRKKITNAELQEMKLMFISQVYISISNSSGSVPDKTIPKIASIFKDHHRSLVDEINKRIISVNSKNSQAPVVGTNNSFHPESNIPGSYGNATNYGAPQSFGPTIITAPAMPGYYHTESYAAPQILGNNNMAPSMPMQYDRNLQQGSGPQYSGNIPLMQYAANNQQNHMGYTAVQQPPMQTLMMPGGHANNNPAFYQGFSNQSGGPVDNY